jgi:hypothetical protein
MPQYGECSSNKACGCLHFPTATEDVGLCAYLSFNGTELASCNPSVNQHCIEEGHACVRHPLLDKYHALCYPIEMALREICPPLSLLTTTSKEIKK